MDKYTIPAGLKKVAVLCVLHHGTEFLLLKRLKEPNKDMYTPVGGKLDPFEDPRSAAVRETFEETGIRVEDLRYGGVLTETSPAGYNWVSFVYLAEIEKMPPPPCNEGTLEWISFDRLLQVPAPATDWYIYQFLLQKRPFALNAVFSAGLQLVQMTEEISGEVLVPAPASI